MVNSHNCSKTVANRNITSKWMEKYYIGIDANDCIYPIAYAAVESENMSSWNWFLDILKTDLDIENTFSIVFMSDRQKGLKEAIEDLFLNADDRKCVRHMYTNFKEKHKGQALKDVVWKAVRATYLREFEDAMDQLKALSKAAYNWIKGKDPSQWSRSHFSTRSKCDMLLNNHCPYQWAPVTDMEPILPPIIRRPLGRPTKRRRLEPYEVTKPKLSRRGMQANYTKCEKQGHNRRTCRGEVGANQPIRRPTLNSSKPRQPQ
ncbi:hypothetical protein V6N13_043203 [Hibiscus sabdariffa]